MSLYLTCKGCKCAFSDQMGIYAVDSTQNPLCWDCLGKLNTRKATTPAADAFAVIKITAIHFWNGVATKSNLVEEGVHCSVSKSHAKSKFPEINA